MLGLLPNKYISRHQLVSLGCSQPPRDEGQDVESDRLKDDVCVPGVTEIYRQISCAMLSSEQLTQRGVRHERLALSGRHAGRLCRHNGGDAEIWSCRDARRRSFITRTEMARFRIEGTAESREVEAELDLEARFVRSS